MSDAPPPPIQDGLFERRGADLVLRGGWSASSGHWHFPLRPVCPYSGADDVVAVDLPSEGRLLWWTAVTAPPPGYEGPVPYGLGVVSLEGQGELRLVTRLSVSDPGELAEGQPMVLVAEELPTADGPRTTWAFRPAGGAS